MNPPIKLPRSGTAHNTSSAFGPSAQPNEDWTKISDLAERRRIQNRIAQRNYRKKQKKRLEDLERKASSPSASPEPESQSPPRVATSRQAPKRSPQSAKISNPSKPLPSRPSARPNDKAATSDDWDLQRQATAMPPYLSSTNTVEPFYQSPCLDLDTLDQPFPCHAALMAHETTWGADFNLDFAAVSIMDGSFSSSSIPDLPPDLCDICGFSSTGSPEELAAFPQTPLMMPMSPSFHSLDL